MCRKVIYLLIISLLFSCKQEDAKSVEAESLKDLYTFIDNKNRDIIIFINKEVIKDGNRPDFLKIQESAESTVKQRQIFLFDSLKNEIKLEKYFLFLTQQFSKSDDFDSSLLVRTENLMNEVKKKRKLIDYQYFLLNSLLIENKILNSYYARVGSTSCYFFEFYTQITKDKDTINAGKTYAFAILPLKYNNGIAKDHINPKITIKLNGKEKDIPYTKENIGGLVIVKMFLEEKGKYQISGSLDMKSRFDNLFKPITFIDNVYVK